MEQLLQITTVPIQYELKVSNAHLERRRGTAELEITRDKGGMHIKSRPVKLNIDSFEARNSVVPTAARSIAQQAEKGQTAAYNATAAYAEEGNLMLKAQIGQGSEVIDQILAQRTAVPDGTDFNVGFIPSQRPEISSTPASLTIEYQMDKLNFDAKVDKGQIEFIPGDIQLTITQHPEVKIEYIGDPIYVPPSVAERFTGRKLDMKL